MKFTVGNLHTGRLGGGGDSDPEAFASALKLQRGTEGFKGAKAKNVDTSVEHI